MKNLFFEFYTISEEQEKYIWEAGILVLDTSALLNLYRNYSKEGRDDLIKLLSNCQERIWIPYQVGWEYHRNLYNTISSVETSCEKFERNLNSAKSEFFRILNLKEFRHPYIKFEPIKDELNQCFLKIKNRIKNTHDADSEKQEFEELINKIAALFDGRVGSDFNEVQLDEIFKEGDTRYQKQIPPGFCDLKNKKDRSAREKYGDLIVWKQIIEHSKEQESDVILITGDRKEDWFELNKHETINPRKELIKEFRQETGHNILIYEFNDFIKKINNFSSLDINTSTLEEVDKISKKNRYNFSGQLSDVYFGRYGIDSIISNYLNNNPHPNTETIKYLERLSPYELPGMQNTPLDTYLRANTAHPDIEVIKYLERLSPYELPGMQNTPLDTYLRANTVHPDIEVIKYLERLSPYELPGMQNTPLDTYLRANAAHPDIEVIQSLDRTK